MRRAVVRRAGARRAGAGRRTTALVGVLLLPLVVAACTGPGADPQDHARSREEVRAAAVETVPALAEALGGEVLWARGEYEAYGLKDTRSLAYQADAEIAAAATRQEVAAAVADLGWAVDEGDGDAVVGERDDLTLSASVRDGVVRLSVDGPQLPLADEGPERNGQESLGLPYPTFVPQVPPEEREDATTDG